MGLGACGTGLSVFFGVEALYMTIEKKSRKIFGSVFSGFWGRQRILQSDIESQFHYQIT